LGVYSDIGSHQAMVFDEVRNTAYAEAIRATVTPGCRVLDLGAGLGIHGLLAVAAGAGEVILLDPSPVVDIAAQVARANGLDERMRVVRKRIEEAELETPVDVLISVFTGNFLLTEDLLPSLFSARNRFLKPGGVMLPGRARMKTALVTAEAFHDKHVGHWSRPALDISYEPVRRFAANGVYYGSAKSIDAQMLCDPVTLQEFDLQTAASADCCCSVEMKVSTAGTCHGILGWFDMQLGERWLSTGPEAAPMHWSLAFLPLEPPVEFEEGQRVGLELIRPEFGDWTWTVSWDGGRQRHSTFQYKLADLKFLKKQLADYVPGLGRQGEVALYVLKQMKEGKCVAEILDGFGREFPALVERDPQLHSRIRNMVNKWGREEG
jgi:protein arginine N-methyltransferase 1